MSYDNGEEPDGPFDWVRLLLLGVVIGMLAWWLL